MTTYWIDGDNRTFRSKDRAVRAAKDAARWTSGQDIRVYRTAYADEARRRGAHCCASHEYEVCRFHAKPI